MARTTPTVKQGQLSYISSQGPQTCSVESPAWYTWLETATLFAFEDREGSFTARKERSGNKRGQPYWKAYRKRAGKLYRAYLGSSNRLTLSHLKSIASQLTTQVTSPLILPPSATKELPPSHHQQTFTHIPKLLTSFVPREKELTSLRQLLLHTEVRLLTLTGPGGVGKTRLALELAHRMRNDFSAGVTFVSLASITEIELVLPTIAQVLGIKERPKQTQEERVLDFLHNKELLLVLDNFEQVAYAASSLPLLLAGCPQVKLLITSRAVLHLSGEYEFPVQPLTIPDPSGQSWQTLEHESNAVALFCQRAREAQAHFQVTATNASAIIELCLRLDGLPLAIELAAARSKILPPQALLVRLEQGLHLLSSSAINIPLRQRTLYNTMQWSYQLLTPDEQTFFRLLSIFEGDFSLTAAETLGCRLALPDPLEKLSSLMDKSLLKQTCDEQENPRLLMLKTIRDFGLECLIECNEAQQAQQAHAEYYLQQTEQIATHLFGSEQASWLEQLEQDHENIRAALRWFIEAQHSEEAQRLCIASARFWTIRGYVTEGCQWFLLALDLPINTQNIPTTLARALSWAAWLAVLQGDLEQGEKLCERSLLLYQTGIDPQGKALALHRMGLIKARQQKFPAMEAFLEESIHIYHTLSDNSGQAYSLMALGRLNIGRQDPAKISQWLTTSYELFVHEHNEEGMAWALYSLARIAILQQNWKEGAHFADQAEIYFRKLQLDEGLIHLMLLCCQLSFQQQQPTYDRLLTLLQKQRTYLNDSMIATILMSLTALALLTHHKEQATHYWSEAIAILQQPRYKQERLSALIQFITILAHGANPRSSAQLLGLASTFLNSETPTSAQIFMTNTSTSLQTKLGKASFRREWQKGEQLTLEEALSCWYAPHNHATTRASELSPREQEVLQLLAQSLTTVEIAGRLVISPRTVDAHIRSIFVKLAVTSRSAATRYALEHHLVP
ncbi:LuxR C-terminal-related transcriptional regulator [Tengunoibacter tsumagoiensis]|uniref:HTH luxR-type domain-containing protein n=1 Tax=Tengunoibacter tsumagoiensis TaxID=2014871 RepID=A0A402A9V1_9CHLR|nr:LuxR C-terminal-related transcriptional regulator [Tengunoibacter tsumagoiensis]GCE15933.1 hypothetical protein KTT_57920 [Tengunoibacter tsumagoiensis]